MTRCKSETIISVNCGCRICTPCARCFAKRPHLCRVHIHSICHGSLRVPPLRRVTFSKRRKSNQKGLPYHTAASPRLGGSLTPALSWGHAATGHPWPIAALPASMPVDPLRRTSSRPPGRAGRSKKHCATRRPTGRPFGASVCYTISVAAAEERRLRSATKSSQNQTKCCVS